MGVTLSIAMTTATSRCNMISFSDLLLGENLTFSKKPKKEHGSGEFMEMVELAKEAFNSNTHQQRLNRISQMVEIQELHTTRVFGKATLYKGRLAYRGSRCDQKSSTRYQWMLVEEYDNQPFIKKHNIIELYYIAKICMSKRDNKYVAFPALSAATATSTKESIPRL
nr:NUDIX hydrolase 6-like protein [Tanacetum cinerariifolium]